MNETLFGDVCGRCLGPADRDRTCIPRLGGMCTIHCATARHPDTENQANVIVQHTMNLYERASDVSLWNVACRTIPFSLFSNCCYFYQLSWQLSRLLMPSWPLDISPCLTTPNFRLKHAKKSVELVEMERANHPCFRYSRASTA